MTRLQELEHMLKSNPTKKLVRLRGGRWVMHDGYTFRPGEPWWGPATIKRAVSAGLVEGPYRGPLTQCKKEGK